MWMCESAMAAMKLTVRVTLLMLSDIDSGAHDSLQSWWDSKDNNGDDDRDKFRPM